MEQIAQIVHDIGIRYINYLWFDTAAKYTSMTIVFSTMIFFLGKGLKRMMDEL